MKLLMNFYSWETTQMGNQYENGGLAVNVVIAIYIYSLAFVLFYDQEVTVLFCDYPACLHLQCPFL